MNENNKGLKRPEVRICESCRRVMPKRQVGRICETCREAMLFREVRDYIRSHDVNEYQLAETFNISQSKVQRWIKEGRIEYVTAENKATGTYCERCNKQITFGTLCPDCLRLMNGKGARRGYMVTKPDDNNDNKMRFLDGKK